MTWRLIPYLFFLYILAYLDRVNVGFAALEMQRDLHLSYTVFGIGGGIFFIGYMLFDLPSNLMLQRAGARRWISSMMIAWGVVATAMAFVTGMRSFYTLRFLLGITEAGFFPGIILYLTYWFPSHERARAVAKFMTATSIAGVIGGPFSGWLLKMEGHGLHGWQWLMLSEGIPTILGGISVLFILNDGPNAAGWLRPEEKQWLAAELERDRIQGGAAARHRLADAFRMPMVWMLAMIYFLSQMGVYTVNLWLPLLLHSLTSVGGMSAAATASAASMAARYATVPYIAAAICTVFVGWSSDRTGERRGHIAGCMLVSTLGCAWAAYAHSMAAMLCAMCLAAIGYWSMMGPFWALPTGVLGGRGAAGGVSIIMVFGGLGGFLGPSTTGKLYDMTHSFTVGLLSLGGVTLLAGTLCLALPRCDRKSTEKAADPAHSRSVE